MFIPLGSLVVKRSVAHSGHLRNLFLTPAAMGPFVHRELRRMPSVPIAHRERSSHSSGT